MASDFRRYAVSRSDSISRHKEIGTITAVGSPPSFETYWISAPAINYSVLPLSTRGLAERSRESRPAPATGSRRNSGRPASKPPKEPRLDWGGMFCHIGKVVQKIAVTLDQRTVADLNRWVREGMYPNRSRALQSAVSELARIDPKEEKQLAEQGLGDRAWPKY